MFFSNKMPSKKVKRAPALTLDCQNCQNTTEHELFWIVPGVNFRYMGKVIAGKKLWVYVCPVCQNIGQEITKEQAATLRIGA